MSEITREEAQSLLLSTFNEFLSLFGRLEPINRATPFITVLADLHSLRAIVGMKSFSRELFDGLSAEGYNYLLQECSELADLFDLSVKNRMIGKVDIIHRSGQRDSALLDAAASGEWLAGGIRSGWRNNGNGTFTAERGATLWGLYGSEWQEKSGYTGDPERLQPGTVVGRNNAIVEWFDNGIGADIRNHLGEEYYDEIRDFFVHNAAYPARHTSVEEILTFFNDLGVEIEEVDPKSEDMETVLAGLTMGEGTAVHIAIAEKYEDANQDDDTIKSNFIPIRSILKGFPKEHTDIPEGRIAMPNKKEGAYRRPDITSIRKCIIYEIKPSHRLIDARDDLKFYRDILNRALEPVRTYITLPREPGNTIIPGPDGVLGAPAKSNPEIVTVGTGNYKYWAEEAGIILYEKAGSRQPQPQVQTLPSPVAFSLSMLIAFLLSMLMPPIPMPLQTVPGLVPIMPQTGSDSFPPMI